VTDLRKYARGKPCMIRSAYCNGDESTTVLAHIRSLGISGIGHKAPDLLGAWACSTCHDAVDGRTSPPIPADDRRALLYQGMARTINQLIRDEVIKW
jgi:hypothetical protein